MQRVEVGRGARLLNAALAIMCYEAKVDNAPDRQFFYSLSYFVFQEKIYNFQVLFREL